MGVKDYNLNPDNNTQINGINIAEGCPPSGINNAIRQLMADVKADSDAQNEKASTPASGSNLGPVKVGDGLTMGKDGTLSLDLVDAVDSTSTTQAATANAVKMAYDKAEEAASDVTNVMSAVGQVQAEVATKLDNDTVHIVKTWKSSDGYSWYRKWSDGFIEQGGHTEKTTGYSNVTITLVTNMTTNTYNIQITSNRPSTVGDGVDFFYDVTTTGFKAIIVGEQPGLSARWYACGY